MKYKDSIQAIDALRALILLEPNLLPFLLSRRCSMNSDNLALKTSPTQAADPPTSCPRVYDGRRGFTSGQGNRTSGIGLFACFAPVDGLAVVRGLRPVVEAVISDDVGDPQAVRPEHAVTPCTLRFAVMVLGAPACDRCLVCPEGEREDPAGGIKALEALDGDEALDRLELGAQRGGDGQIVVAPAVRRRHLEDDGDHRGPMSAKLEGSSRWSRMAHPSCAQALGQSFVARRNERPRH